MVRLSAIVITKNEEENIGECLESLSFVDEVVLIDSESTDRTVEIARQYTRQITVAPWRGYAGTKQMALEKARGEWILWLDADERVPVALAEEILNVLDRNPSIAGFQMPRKAYFLGRWIKHSGWYPGYVIRLFRKNQGRFGEERVHETLQVDGPIGTLREPMDHYTDRTVQHYFNKLNRYTSLAARDMKDRGRRISVPGILVRPVIMFMKMYIIKAGFLDGIQGFLLAVFSSYYIFIKYTKLWELLNGRCRSDIDDGSEKK